MHACIFNRLLMNCRYARHCQYLSFHASTRRPVPVLGVLTSCAWCGAVQMFSLSDKGQLRREEVCASVHRRSSKVTMTRCSAGGRDQIWTMDRVR